MHVDMTITVGNILTLVGGVVAIIIFFVRQENLHGQNDKRMALIEQDLSYIRSDVKDIKEDIKTNKTIIFRKGPDENMRFAE